MAARQSLEKNAALGGPAVDGIPFVPVNRPNRGNVRLVFEGVIGQRQDGEASAADRSHGISGRAAHFTVQFRLGRLAAR